MKQDGQHHSPRQYGGPRYGGPKFEPKHHDNVVIVAAYPSDFGIGGGTFGINKRSPRA
jgi:hypothetical protein